MDILGTVKRLKALDNEVKLEILSYLVNQGAKSITDISKELKLNFSTTHKYLEELEAAELVKSKQEVKSRLKRIFYINDFEINISPRALSRFQDQTVQADKPEHDFNVITLTGRTEKFDRTRFVKEYLELGLPQNIIDLILDSILPSMYNNITTLELRRRFLQELEGRNDVLWNTINKLKEVRLGQTNYLNFLTATHPEAIEQHTNGEIFIENLGRPKLLNFVHDLRGISIHGVTGKKPQNLTEFLNQILKATNALLNVTKPLHSFDSFNYFIAPYTEKLSEYDIELELTAFFKKLSDLNIRVFVNIEFGEPEFVKKMPTEYFLKHDKDVYAKYTSEAKRLIKPIFDAAKKYKQIQLNLKIWEYNENLKQLVSPLMFITNMTPAWQKENASYIYESRFDSLWKGWARTVRTGIVQNISINLPLIANKTNDKTELMNKLATILTSSVHQIVDMSNLFLNTSLTGTPTTFQSAERVRWNYVQFEDSLYSISLANLNELSKLSNQKLSNIRTDILSFCSKLIRKLVQNSPIRIALKEEHNPVILKRFHEVNKLNNIYYSLSEEYDAQQLIESANHDKLNGGHMLCIKSKDLDLQKLLRNNVGLVSVL